MAKEALLVLTVMAYLLRAADTGQEEEEDSLPEAEVATRPEVRRLKAMDVVVILDEVEAASLRLAHLLVVRLAQ
jgi:hypothetical protein